MKAGPTALKTEAAGITVDFMRGTLALLVLVAHALESGLLLVKGASLPAWLSVTLGHGGFWVNGFFVLSGFCIHRSIMAQHARGGPFVAGYVASRLTRLYPLYLIALALALMLVDWPSVFTLSSHLLMMQGITGTVPALKPAWSLTYEILYYAFWPMILLSCGWQVRKPLLLAGSGTLLLAGALMAFWKWSLGGAAGTWVLPLALIAAQFPLWLGGAWLAEAWEAMSQQVHVWLLPISALWVSLGYLLQAWLLHLQSSASALIILGWLVLPGWLGLVLGSAAWPGIVKGAAVARWLGLLSYPLYILHQPLLDMLVKGARAWHFQASLPATFLLLLAWVMVCMILAGVPLESALLRWRSRWLGGKGKHQLKAAVP